MFKKVISLYNLRGFFIKYILGDGELRYMIDAILTKFKCHLNCMAVGEHVPKAERAIPVIKERIRCIVNSWAYKEIPTVMKTSLVKFVVFWLNLILRL